MASEALTNLLEEWAKTELSLWLVGCKERREGFNLGCDYFCVNGQVLNALSEAVL